MTLVCLAESVTPQIVVENNTNNNAVWGISTPIQAANATANLHATHGWTGASYDPATRTAAPFAVLDSMFTAATAFTAVRNVVFPPLHVNWSPDNVPQSGTTASGQIGTSHFSRSDGEIYVLGKDGVDTDEYDSHVIVHEWGHYFEANLSRSDSPGGRHGPGDILDPRIAFGEAWGNSVASMVLPESVYSDSSWANGNPSVFGFDLETEPTPTDDPTPSAFSEASVMRVLYDIYDPSNESFDGVATGLGTIYDVLTGPEKTTDAVTTLGSFITGLKAQPGVSASAVDTLLAHYQIGPISTEWGDGDTNLRGMFTDALLPFSGSIALGGGYPANSWQQNQYYVFTGTGGAATVSATSTEDVAIFGFHTGVLVGSADANLSGTETFSLNTQVGTKYVVVLTGFGATSGDYNVTVSIQ